MIRLLPFEEWQDLDSKAVSRVISDDSLGDGDMSTEMASLSMSSSISVLLTEKDIIENYEISKSIKTTPNPKGGAKEEKPDPSDHFSHN